MNKKYIIGILLVLIVAGVVGIIWAMKSPENPGGVGGKDDMKGVIGVPDGKDKKDGEVTTNEKKGIKRFTLKAVGDSTIAGDGSITLKDKLTSAAVRLTSAPALPAGTQYEVYVVLKTGDPVYAGTLQTFTSPNAKYLWGGAGQVSWFDATKFIVTKRSNSQEKPGTVLAEAALPSQYESLQ